MLAITMVRTDSAGETLLLRKASGDLATSKAGEKLDPKPVDMAGVKMLVDPVAEWRQIFNNA